MNIYNEPFSLLSCRPAVNPRGVSGSDSDHGYNYMKMINLIVYVTLNHFMVVTYFDVDSFYLNITIHYLHCCMTNFGFIIRFQIW